MKVYKYIVCAYFIALLILTGSLFTLPARDAEAQKDLSHTFPKVANIYLGSPISAEDVKKLAQWDVLILHMLDQMAFAAEMREIRRLNPDIIILAYVPSEEFPISMYQAWEANPNGLWHRLLAGITPDMWLLDERGNHVTFWADNWMLNVANYGSHGRRWNEYLADFVAREIMSTGLWDGIFYDNTWTGISWINGGRIDINRDGKNDPAAEIDRVWEAGMQTLFELTRQKAGRDIIILGNGDRGYNGSINGLYIENFTLNTGPGGWTERMRHYRNTATHRFPTIGVVGNTSLGRNAADYRSMRYGLTSALMENGYYAFDGKDSHAEMWWYDEYNAKLGNPTNAAVSISGAQNYYNSEVWRRDYETGVALVNPTAQNVTVDLGGEYEKLIGTQDRTVNDGAIVNSVTIPAKDGLIMFKTFRTLKQTVFTNGSFVRFYKQNGERARNGFFVFEENLPGGAKIFTGDLDGDHTTEEKIVITGPKMEIFDSRGERWMMEYPFGTSFRGDINVALGPLKGLPTPSIVVAPSRGGQVIVYNYFGALERNDVYPLGKKYGNGFSVAYVGTGPGTGQFVFTTLAGRQTEVLFYDLEKNKINGRFSPYGRFSAGASITAGDFNGDGTDEIATIATYNRRPLIRTFLRGGKKLSEFNVSGIFSTKPLTLAAADVNFEGKKEIVVMTSD